jgi:aspartyl-tRNA(Asn)/glutamyl-tRNA(Gln) amidotransferase subunit B
VIAEVEGEEHSFAVNRVHLEDDAGMLKHFSNFAGVDYNRAGVPLVEIVSEPCIHSAKQAVAYGMAVKAILQYIDASDCNMEEGSLRMDANISVRKKGEKGLRNKIEIKNMNSFSNMQIAIDAEIKRQINLYTSNPDIPSNKIISQATFRWDPDTKETVLMRSKEYAEDYRYFPEPDLVPIVLTDAYIEKIRSELPELPLQRERRYVKELGIAPDSAFVLTSDKLLADYFEEALKVCNNPRSLCNWLIVEFAGRYKDSDHNLLTSGIPPSHVGKLMQLIENKTITGKIAKAVADDMIANPEKDPEQIVKENPDYLPMGDRSAIEPIVDQILAENPQSIEDFKKGKEKAFAFLVGQVMRLTRGKASPEIVNELIKQKIGMK